MFSAAFHRIRNAFTHTTAAACTAAALAATAWALPHTASAQEFVSIQGHTGNVRAQPNGRAEVRWELTQGYPLQVTARQGQWLQVRDHEAALGWVHRPITSKQPHHVVTARSANLRQGPGQQHRITGKLQQHEVVKTIDKRTGWAKVRRSNGTQGWVARNLLWGW